MLRPASRCVLLLALCTGGYGSARDLAGGDLSPSSEALFKEAFGAAPEKKPRAIPLELEVDGQGRGLVSTLLPRNGTPAEALPMAAPVLAALEGLLPDEQQAQLATAVEPSGHLPLRALRALGLEAAYDPSRLAIVIHIPARLRRTRVSTLGRRTALEGAELVPTSRLSGFLNFRMAQDLGWVHGPEGSSQRQPLRLGVEGAFNVAGWVLEGRGEVAEGPQAGWSRGDVRLVRDDPAHAVRWVAGNIATPTRGFQPGRSLLGVSATRNFSLDPSRQIMPEEAMSFSLERPSKVEVLINGQLVQTLQLAAGPQDLRGLLLDLGSNELELLITDDLGTQQRITKRVGLASGQLGPGVSEFAYSAGVPLAQASLQTGYDWARPTLHLVHRRGLGQAFTLGGSVQADPTAQTLSLEPLWATFLGSVSTTAALSHQAGELGYAAGARYELQRGGKGQGLLSTFGIGGEYRSLAFAPPGELLAAPRPAAVLSAFYGQALGAGFQGRLGGEARVQGAGARPGYAATFSLSKSFRNGLLLMMDTSARMTAEQGQELRGRLNLMWAFPESRRTVTALTQVSDGSGPSSELAVNQELQAGSATVNATAGLGQDALSRRSFESLRYRGQRAEAEVTHRLVDPTVPDGAMNSVVQARVGMALVFADGLFALSRPVTNSFAIVAPTRALEGQWIGVNPGTTGYSGAADWLGPAVLPDLQPYAASRLRVAAPDLPMGYSLGEEERVLRPTYRSGTVVRVGEEGSVLLRGVLRDEQGAPVALTSGTVVRMAEALEEPVAFFTNRTGRFVLPALRPGAYLLRLDGAPQGVHFSIPEGSVGVFELGQVALDTAMDGAEREGRELVATEVRLDRTTEVPVAEPAAPALASVTPSTLRGRLYGDRNANGITEPEEPVFPNVRVGAAGVAATTDSEGQYELKGLTGTEVVLRVETPEALPFGMVPAERTVALAAPEVSADLLLPAARFPMAPSGAFTVALPEGRVRAVQLDKASFPLAAWVAGLPLSRDESSRLAGLAERVHESKQLRLLVVARAQTQGKLRGAVKRAFLGAKALQRYLQATQLVPGKKLGITVVEALPGFESPLGQIDLVLVRVEGAAEP